MNELTKQVAALTKAVQTVCSTEDFKQKEEKLHSITTQLDDPDVWKDNIKAQEFSKQQAKLKAIVDPWVSLRTQVIELKELVELNDDSLTKDIETQFTELQSQLDVLQEELKYNGQYDDHDVILRLHAGAGGVVS